MGVTYKLKDDVVQYILSQRRENPKLSCQRLAEMVLETYQVQVSKSSVHEVLKEAQIVTPRGRKPKDTFSIPAEKKAQIKALLPPLPKPIEPPPLKPAPVEEIAPDSPEPSPVEEPLLEGAEEPSLTLRPDPLAPPPAQAEPEILPKAPLERSEIYDNAGEIFLNAALWDLMGEKYLNIKNINEEPILPLANLQVNWEYVTTLSTGIEITFKDHRMVYIDGRFQKAGAQMETKALVPIERAVKEAADFVVNNSKVLFIREIDPVSVEVFKDFGKNIQKIAIVGQNAQRIVNFDQIVDFRRHFIAKILGKVELVGLNFRFIEKTGHYYITNLSPTISDNLIVDEYNERFPEPFSFGDFKRADLPLAEPKSWLKEKVTSLASHLFLADLPWEKISALRGFEERNSAQRIVHILVEDSAVATEQMQRAVLQLNSANICDPWGRKVVVALEI